MKDNLPVYVPEIIGACVDYVKTKLPLLNVRYTYGRRPFIVEELLRINSNTSQSAQSTKYPLIALYYDFPEKRGVGGYYGSIVIPTIQIACLSNESDFMPDRYTKNFKPILYPIYYALLEGMARNPNIVQQDPNFIVHTKYDRPKVPPYGKQLTDWADSIELTNINLTISQTKTCN